MSKASSMCFGSICVLMALALTTLPQQEHEPSPRRTRRDVTYLNYDLPWPIGAYGAPIEQVVVDDHNNANAVYGRNNVESTKLSADKNRQKRDVTYLNYDLPWPIGAYGAPIEQTVVDDNSHSNTAYGRSNAELTKKPNSETRQKRNAGFFDDDMPWPRPVPTFGGLGGRSGRFGVPNPYGVEPMFGRSSWSFPFAPRVTNRNIPRGRSGLNLFAAAGVEPSYKTELFESSFADDVADGSGDDFSSYRRNPLAARKSVIGFGQSPIAIDPLTGLPATPTQRASIKEAAVHNYKRAIINNDVLTTADAEEDDDYEDDYKKSKLSISKDGVPTKVVKQYRYFDERKDNYKVVPKIKRKEIDSYSLRRKRINKHLYNIHRQHIHEHIRNHHLLEIHRHRHPIQKTEVITYIHNRRIPIEYTHNTYTNDKKVIVDVLPTKVHVTRKSVHLKPIYEPVRRVVKVIDAKRRKKYADKLARRRPDYVQSHLEIDPLPLSQRKVDGKEEQLIQNDLEQRFNAQPQQQQFFDSSDFDSTSHQQQRIAKLLQRRRMESLDS